MFQILHGIALIATLVVNSNFAFAEDFHSANRIMPGCRSAIAEEKDLPAQDGNAILLAGFCMGAVAVLRYSPACVPITVPIVQAVTVIVRYIDNRPARWHESFLMLANEALLAAWPCKR
jgi:hypothetical protein